MELIKEIASNVLVNGSEYSFTFWEGRHEGADKCDEDGNPEDDTEEVCDDKITYPVDIEDDEECHEPRRGFVTASMVCHRVWSWLVHADQHWRHFTRALASEPTFSSTNNQSLTSTGFTKNTDI